MSYNCLSEDPFFYTTLFLSLVSITSVVACCLQLILTFCGLSILCGVMLWWGYGGDSIEEEKDEISGSVETPTETVEEELHEIKKVSGQKISKLVEAGEGEIPRSIREENFLDQQEIERRVSGEHIRGLLSKLELGPYAKNFEERAIISIDELLDLDGDPGTLKTLIPEETNRKYFSHFLSDSVQKIEYKETYDDLEMSTIDILEIMEEEAETHHVSSPYSPFSTKTEAKVKRRYEESEEEKARRTKKGKNHLRNEAFIVDPEYIIICRILKRLNLERYCDNFSQITLDGFLDLREGEGEDLLSSLIPNSKGRAKLLRFVERSVDFLERRRRSSKDELLNRKAVEDDRVEEVEIEEDKYVDSEERLSTYTIGSVLFKVGSQFDYERDLQELDRLFGMYDIDTSDATVMQPASLIGEKKKKKMKKLFLQCVKDKQQQQQQQHKKEEEEKKKDDDDDNENVFMYKSTVITSSPHHQISPTSTSVDASPSLNRFIDSANSEVIKSPDFSPRTSSCMSTTTPNNPLHKKEEEEE